MMNAKCTLEAPDWDDSYSLCFNDDDSCYIGVDTDKSGFWVWVSVDCNTAHFTADLLGQDGPCATYLEAVEAGITCAVEWGCNNDLPCDDSEIDAIREAALIDKRFCVAAE